MANRRPLNAATDGETPDGDGPWVPSNSASRTSDRVYHTDPECPNLGSAEDYRLARDYEVEEYDECIECANVSYRNGDSDRSYYDALVEADPDAI